MAETLLIINPHAHGGKSAVKARQLKEYLKKKAYRFDEVETENFGDVYKYSAEANNAGIKNIVAVGGDGTINKVINGFYDDYGNKISSSRLGVVHTGTSPDFCKSYDIPTDIKRAADIIIGQKVRSIPVGMIKLKTGSPCGDEILSSANCTSKTMYFACCANIGLGAALARSANSGIRNYAGDFLGTLISLIKILMNYEGNEYNTILNNRERRFENIINISVGITRYIASGINIRDAEAMPADHFYILTIPKIKLLNIPGLLRLLYSGKKVADSALLSIEYAPRFEILNNSTDTEVEFDGDPAGYLPCTIEIAKDKLQIFTIRGKDINEI